MTDFLQTIWRQLREFWDKLTRAQRIQIGALSAVLLVVLAVAVIVFSRVDYAVLYSDMEDAEAGEVFALLETMNAKPKITQTGEDNTTILVPANQVEQLRMQLAAEGYPKTGNSYDIYQMGSGLTTNSQTQQAYYTFQLQENLRRDIKKMNGVKDASVNLNIVEKSAFVVKRNEEKSTASIVLTLEDGFTLSPGGVKAIAYIVAAACSDMAPEDVAITDTTGRLYSMDEEEVVAPFDPNDKYAAERAFEKSLEQRLTELLTPAFGPGKVVVSAKATMDFDRQTIEQKTYSPVPDANNEPIAVSYRELMETISSADATTGGLVGTDANGGAPTYPQTDESGTSGPYSRVEREVNNALNAVNTTIEKVPGTLTDLTVSVVYQPPEGDTSNYDDMVRNIVMNAAGIKDKKSVTAASMTLAAGGNAIPSEEALSMNAALVRDAQLNQIIRLVVIALAFVVVVFLFARLLRDITKLKVAPMAGMELATENGAPLYDLLVGEEEEPEALPEFELGNKNLNRERIEQLIERDPESVAQLLRSWLTDEV